jgi:hypothetical protein
MLDVVDNFLRRKLKEEIVKCTEEQIHFFKRMYSPDNLKLTISKVIDNMPQEKLEHAYRQVKNTIERFNKVNNLL